MLFRKPLRRSAFLLALCLVAPACSAWTESRESYRQEILDWRAERLDNLKGPTGYLNLVALFTLREGEQSFGFAQSNVHRLTHVSAPKLATIGTFHVQGDSVRFRAQPEVAVTHEGAPVSAICARRRSTGFGETRQRNDTGASGRHPPTIGWPPDPWF